jgi:D-glycero-D-manno-heptose 1,7-bisphosphate phosphatase
MQRANDVGIEPRRAVFLDRDGVICRNRVDHVKSWDEFVFLPQARESLARLTTLNLAIVVITNQAAINRGLVTEDIVEQIHDRMRREISLAGGRIDRVYYCPHRPDERCACRKPEPGMLLRAASDLGIELQGSYLVGDAWSDIQAGTAVGCVPYLVMTGRAGRQAPEAFREVTEQARVVADLSEAVTAIHRYEGPASFEMAPSQTLRTLDNVAPQARVDSHGSDGYRGKDVSSLDDAQSLASSMSEPPAMGIRQ